MPLGWSCADEGALVSSPRTTAASASSSLASAPSCPGHQGSLILRGVLEGETRSIADKAVDELEEMREPGYLAVLTEDLAVVKMVRVGPVWRGFEASDRDCDGDRLESILGLSVRFSGDPYLPEKLSFRMQMKIKPQRYWLLLPFWVLAILDHLLTVIGQSDRYWQGNYHEASENNPLSIQLLFQSPLVFLTVFVAGYLVIGFIILRVSCRVSSALVLSFVVGHAWGASSWFHVWISAPYDYFASILLFVASSFLLSSLLSGTATRI